MYPLVGQERCASCRNCFEIYPGEVNQMEEDKSNPAHPEECIDCWACVTQCPAESIQPTDD